MNMLLVTTLVLQWIAIFALAILGFALVRQIGILHQRIAPAGALMISQGIRIGSKVPETALVAQDGVELTIGGTSNRSTIIVFVAPDCPVCASLVPALKAIGRQESSWLRIVVASDGKDAAHDSFRQEKGLNTFPYVISTELGLMFQVAKLPFGVLVGEDGVLISQGLVNSREHLESLFEAKRYKVASIQDYLSGSG